MIARDINIYKYNQIAKARVVDQCFGFLAFPLSLFCEVWVRLMREKSILLSTVKDAMCPRMGQGGSHLEILLKMLEKRHSFH